MQMNRTFPGRRNAITQALLGGLVLGVGSLALAQTDAETLDRITITAEKRKTVLEMTPDAITVLAGAKLKDQGTSTLADLVNLIPNTTFTTGLGSSQLFMRGIGNVFLTAGGDPGVALYADGAYVSDQTSSNVSLFDVYRVEALRGPQGALYGRNATGGAINFISARPTDSLAAQIGVVLGDYGRRESEGFFSGPLSESTKARLSYQVKATDGFASNQLAGQSFGPVLAGKEGTSAPKAVDDLGSQALRLQTATDFGGGGNLRLIAGAYRQRDNGQSNAVLPEATPTITQLLYGASQTGNPRSVKSQAGSNAIDVSTLQAIYEQPVGDNTLSVVASYRKSASDALWDGDQTEALMATTHFKTSSRDVSLDAHLASAEGGALQWLVGVNHVQFDQTQDVDVSAQVPLGFLVPGAPFTVPLPGGVNFLLGGNVHARASAVYADLRYALTPSLALLGGVRWANESKTADEYLNIAAFGLGATGTPSASWSSTPGSLGLEYQISPETLTYAKIARGFKSGAINLGAIQSEPVRPETVTSFEIGFKSSFAKRSGTISAALFKSDYKDMQVVQIGQASPILANAAGAQISGLEVEATYKPAAHVTLNASLGLMDPKYTEFINVDQRHSPMGPAINVAGNQLANVSRTQASLGVDFVQNMGGYRTTWHADYLWRSRFFFTEFNTADAMQDDVGVLNLSAAFKQGPWKFIAFVKNATNVTALSSMSISSPVLGAARTVNYAPPRYFGVGVTYDF
ncbi:MAG: TonB-dependent receptor [Pseudomonadota bacterium]